MGADHNKKAKSWTRRHYFSDVMDVNTNCNVLLIPFDSVYFLSADLTLSSA